MTKYADIKIKCQQCGREFVVMEDELQFYKQKGLTLPRRCKECRSKSHKKVGQLVCSECGSKIDRTVTVYCGNCHSSDIANIKLECELNNKKIENAFNEIRMKLEAAKIEKSKLEKTLSQKEKKVEELKQTVVERNEELDKVKRLRNTIEKSFQSELKSMEKSVGEGLKSTEDENRLVKKELIQINNSLKDMKKEWYGLNLIQLIKRSFRIKNK